LHKHGQLLENNLFNLIVVDTLGTKAFFLLLSVVFVELVVLLVLENSKGLLLLHLVEKAVDIHEARLVVRSGLDQGSRELLSRLVVGAVADVALPQREHL